MSAEGATAADGSAGLVARSRLWLLCLLLCTGQAEFESGLPLSLATGQQLLSDVAVTLVAMGGSVVASAVSVQLAKLVATSVCVTVGYLLLRRERLSAPTRGPNLPVTPSTSAAATCQHTTRRIAGAERAGGKLCGVLVLMLLLWRGSCHSLEQVRVFAHLAALLGAAGVARWWWWAAPSREVVVAGLVQPIRQWGECLFLTPTRLPYSLL